VEGIPLSLYPDYTVGPGVSPDLLTQVFRKKHKALAGYTAGRELHPAPKDLTTLL
jgi:hypothetical protein